MKLEAELLKIDGECRKSRRWAEPKERWKAYEQALWKAYDAIAAEVTREDQSEEALAKTIPERVLKEALRFGWVTNEECKPQHDLDGPPRRRGGWLGDTTGWLDGVSERIKMREGLSWHEALRQITQEPLPPPQPSIEVAGVEVPLSWWEHRWVPIFTGCIQAWRARLMSDKPLKADREKTFPRRAAWLRARLLERGWGEREVADHAQVAEKTVRRILRGLPVTQKSLSAVVDALNRHGRAAKVSADTVPSD